MKPEVVPTAPSKLRESGQRTPLFIPQRLSWLILSVVLSLAAGIISTLFMLTVPTNWPIVQAWLDRRDGETVIISNLESTATAEVVQLLQQRSTQAIVTLSSAETALGIGTVVSNDGWIMTTTNVVGDHTTISLTDQSNQTVTSDRIIHDPYSDLTFVHLPLTDLAIADFRQQPALLGDGVIVMSKDAVTQHQLVSVVHLQSTSQPINPERSIAKNNVYYLSDRSITGMTAGAPAFDYEGKLLGLYFKDNTIIPLRTVEHRLLTLLDTGKFKQTKQKLTYTLNAKGAVVQTTKIPELKAGDTIIEVNNQLVNELNDLSWLLAENDTVDVLFMRGDKRRTVRLTID